MLSNRMLRSMSLESGVTPRRLYQVVLPEPGRPMVSTTTPRGWRALSCGLPVAAPAAPGGAVGDSGCVSTSIRCETRSSELSDELAPERSDGRPAERSDARPEERPPERSDDRPAPRPPERERPRPPLVLRPRPARAPGTGFEADRPESAEPEAPESAPESPESESPESGLKSASSDSAKSSAAISAEPDGSASSSEREEPPRAGCSKSRPRS